MLKKVVITVIVLFLIVLVYVRTTTAIKQHLNIESLSHLATKAIHSLNIHIEKMDPVKKQEHLESFERLTKNLQPFIQSFFESGLEKDKKNSEANR